MTNGCIYEGQWHEDMRHGYGRLIQEVGDVYEGEWQNNEFHG